MDPGQAAFPIQASGGALVSGGEVPTKQGGPVYSPLSGLLVRPMTAGGVSVEMAVNLGLTLPLQRESSHSASSQILNEVLATSLPNPSEFSILDDPMFDSSFD